MLKTIISSYNYICENYWDLNFKWQALHSSLHACHLKFVTSYQNFMVLKTNKMLKIKLKGMNQVDKLKCKCNENNMGIIKE